MERGDRLKYLFEKQLTNENSLEERDELFVLIDDTQNDSELKELIEATWDEEFLLHDQPQEKVDVIFQNIIANQAKGKRNVAKFFTFRFAAAAAIFSVLLLGAYLFYYNKYDKQIAKVDTTKKQSSNDVAPGGNKAILTLADGTQVILDSAANGTLTQQGNTKIIKLDDGQLAYNDAAADGQVIYNTISTPNGGQYQIILADGTRVWLNATSSLKFPTTFRGNDRNVELTGEGYFEVAKNASMPFKVKVNDSYVEVLGTHFNINSYSDEPAISTTLLQGKVRVTKGANSINLIPGQQAIVTGSKENIKVRENVDVEEVVAWKNGLINFNGADVGSVMRQIGRWYNVDVESRGNIEAAHVSGRVSRNLNLSQLIKVLAPLV